MCFKENPYENVLNETFGDLLMVEPKEDFAEESTLLGHVTLQNAIEVNKVGAETKNANEFVNRDLEHSSVLAALANEIQPINFYEKGNLSDGEAITKRHYVIICIEQILEVAKAHNWSLCMSDGFVYVYNGAYWKQLSKSELLHFLGKAAEKMGVDQYEAKYFAFHKDLYNQFLATAYLPKPEKKGEEVLINFKNGTFVITPEKQYLKKFDRRDFLTYQLPFEFDPSADAPIFKKFLDRVLPDKTKQMLLSEYVGYVFVRRKTLKLEKSVILFGDGANGKSVFFDVVMALLGADNVSNFSLQSLTGETGYYRAKLANKLLNYASEISPKMDSTLFKQLVSGESVEARQIYGEPYTLEDYAKLIFNTNQLPTNVEHNEAFFRRFVILHFDVTVPEEERDPQLASKIISDELPGVFNWVLQGLDRLLSQMKLTYSGSVVDMVNQYRQQSNTVHMFVKDEGYEKDWESKVSLKDMFNEYREYCSESGNKQCTLREFSERLKKLGFEMFRRSKGYVVNAKKGLFLEGASTAPNTLNDVEGVENAVG